MTYPTTILSVHSFNLTVATGVFPFYLTSDWLSCHVITHYRIELTIDKIVDIVFRKQSIWHFWFYLELLFKNWYLYEDFILNTMGLSNHATETGFVKNFLSNPGWKITASRAFIYRSGILVYIIVCTDFKLIFLLNLFSV